MGGCFEMLSIFAWAFISGAITVCAAQAKLEVSAANKEHTNGLQRAKRQAEIQDLMSRL
jgi:hypothetical protein